LADGTLEVVSLVGNSPRIIRVQGRYLDGPAAWSPDGRFLAVSRAGSCRYPEDDPCIQEIFFVDATGQGGPVPDPLRIDAIGENWVLGWTGPDEVLVLTIESLSEGDLDGGTYWVTAVPLDGSDPRRLSAISEASSFGVGRFQLASALLDDLRVRAASSIDRGPWPILLRIAAAILASIAVALLTSAAMRYRRRPRSPADVLSAKPTMIDTSESAGRPA
jgi:hypothetical protein